MPRSGRHLTQLKPVAVEVGKARIPNGGKCITYTGYFTDGIFLDIQVRRSKGAVELWKNSHPVTAFPPKTTVLLHVVKENCNPHVSQFAPSVTFRPEHIAEIGAPPREYVMKKYGASFFDE